MLFEGTSIDGTNSNSMTASVFFSFGSGSKQAFLRPCPVLATIHYLQFSNSKRFDPTQTPRQLDVLSEGMLICTQLAGHHTPSQRASV